MNNISKTFFAVTMCLASLQASAKYVITFKDKTTVETEDTQLIFSGSGENGTYINTATESYRLSDIASIDYAPNLQPIVLAYHTYYSSKLPNPDLVTHINYGFAEVYVKNGVYQGFKLQGSESAFRKCADIKKQHPEIKILLSFTHTVSNSDNKQDGGFSAIAASDEYRRQFAADCLAFVQKWGIDGIDLDWEFPGLSWSGAACDPANDVANYNLLMKQLRTTLGNDYLLTFAGYCMDKRTTTGGWKYIDLAEVEQYVDFVNIMTYDLDEAPRFHNAIRSSSSYWDIERTIAAYAKVHFPTEKMVLGIPFYVRNTFSNSFAFYKLDTLRADPDYEVDCWDETAQVPYIKYKGVNWGSYDNERSIAAKGVYAYAKGLRGLFYWCTYEDDTNYTLARATWQAVQDNWKR